MRCLACKNDGKLSFWIKALNGIEIFRCKYCDNAQISDKIKELEYDYSEYGDYWENLPKDHIKNRSKVSIPKLIFFNFLKLFIGSNSNILDFGGGAGFFTIKCLKSGFKNTFLFEPSNKLRFIAKNKVDIPKKNIIDKVSKIPDNSLDVIIMLDVIEHLPVSDVDSILLELRKKLKDNGIFAGATPNLNSLNIILHGKNDPVISPPSHSIYFTKKSINCLLNRLGFKKLMILNSGFSTNSFFRKNNKISWVERPTSSQYFFSLIIKIIFKIISIPISFFGYGYHLNYIYKLNK